MPTQYPADFECFILRKELNQWLAELPIDISRSTERDYIWLALGIGKFLKWHGPVIDRRAEEYLDKVADENYRKEAKKSVRDLGEEIRLAAMNRMDGHEVFFSASVQNTSLRRLHDKFDKLEKLIKSEIKRGAK